MMSKNSGNKETNPSKVRQYSQKQNNKNNVVSSGKDITQNKL